MATNNGVSAVAVAVNVRVSLDADIRERIVSYMTKCGYIDENRVICDLIAVGLSAAEPHIALSNRARREAMEEAASALNHRIKAFIAELAADYKGKK